jgi:hypothetical protein
VPAAPGLERFQVNLPTILLVTQSALEKAQHAQEATGEPSKAWTRVLPPGEEETG